MRKYFLYSLLLLLFTSCNEEVFDDSSSLPELGGDDQIIVQEGDINQTITIDVSLSKPIPYDSYVSYNSSIGTAVSSTDTIRDFRASNGQLEFLAGDTTASFTITIFGDENLEEDENFFINFSSATFVSLKLKQIEVIIQNDDDGITSLDIPTEGFESPMSYPGYDLAWNDEFNSTTLSNDWTFEIGAGGWGNDELQYYRPENTELKEGALVITAKKESFSGSQYTSSRIITENAAEFQYGRIDIRAALPQGQGLWPALWMLGANFREVGWPYCGEIDIMEIIGGSNTNNTVHGTIHWQDDGFKADFGGSTTVSGKSLNEAYHVYSIIWTATSISWLIDDVQFHTVSLSRPELDEFRAPFFFIFNIAVGGRWPGNPDETTSFPQRMAIDYIRVFQEQ